MTGLVEVTLLGPPRVERDGVLVAFDTRKAMALLAHLAVTNRPRPRDVLADLLWPDNDPEHARGALRRTLSTLRSGIGGDLLEATRDHVHLIKGRMLSIDVDEFRHLRESGDLMHAVEVFRGEFLEGFGVREAPDFEDWVRAEAEGLRRELTAVLADLARELEAAGDPAHAAEAVRRWLSLDPLHEPAHRALIKLYAASGDRAAALVQYRDCVRTLSRELGVPPLVETTQLYDAINRGSYAAPTPVAEPSPPPPTPGTTTPFVGRADDMRALLGLFEGISDDGRTVLIEGEAGIGKTRLAQELVKELRGLGAQVLVGRAYEDEAGLPFAPIVEILRARLAVGDGWLADVAGRAVSEAARLVPEIRGDRASERLPGLDEPGAETRFLSGVWDTLSAAAEGDSPGVLLVDDAQWADEATAGLLSFGLHRLVGRPMLIVLTWRTPTSRRLRSSAVEAAKAGGAVVELTRLDEVAIRELVRAVRPDDTGRAVSRRLWETTEGVPLLAVEYLRTLGTADEWPVPTGVRELLRTRLDPVSETGRQVLAAAAVLGRSFDIDTVRAVSGRSDEEAVTALEELSRFGLVREGHVGYDFDHELLRALVYDETSLARRRLLHGRAAEALAAPAGSVARHLQLAGRDAEAAAAYRDAGEQARLVFANAEALGHLQAALALGYPDRAGLETAIGDLQTLVGDYAGALLSLESAAAASGPGELASVEHRLGRVQHRRGEYALAEARLQAALAATSTDNPAARAGITADLSLAAHSRGDRDRARSLARDANTLARESDDPRSRCQAHNLLGLLATADGDTDDALRNLQFSRELAEEVGDQGLQVAALNNLALAHRARGELDDAIELTMAALNLCTALGDRHREAALHNNLADLMHAADQSDRAMSHLKSAVAIFAEIGTEEDLRPEIWKLVRW